MKSYKIQYTRWFTPSPTYKCDRKRWFGSKEKALRAADIICTAQDCSVLVINEYVWSFVYLQNGWVSKMGSWSRFLKNSELKGKTTLSHRRKLQASWMCVPCHECCIIWISSLCLPPRPWHCIPTTLFQPQQKEAAGSEFFWSTSTDIRLTCSGVIRCFLFLINCTERVQRTLFIQPDLREQI